jgi:hypothetical protein
MKRKNSVCIREDSEVVVLLKKTRGDVSSTVNDINENATKKFKMYADKDCKELVLIVNEHAEKVIITAIKIYLTKGSSEEKYSDQEKASYLTILKKIQDPREWAQKRVFSNKQQLRCLFGQNFEKKEERRIAMSIVERWNEHKISTFPGKRKQSCADISNHYKNQLMIAGLDNDKLLKMISELSSVNESVSSSKSSISIVSSCSTGVESAFSESSVPSVIADCCRLCGEKNATLVISINKKNRDTTYKQLIEYFCQ